LIYVADDGNGGGNEIEIFNATSPFAHVATVGTAEINNPQFLLVQDGILYVVDDGDHEIDLFDATAPFNFIASVSSTELEEANGVAVSDDYIFVCDNGDDDVDVYDAATYAHLTTINNADFEALEFCYIYNNLLFITSRGYNNITSEEFGEIFVYDISNPFNFVGSFGENELEYLESVEFMGGIVYAADEYGDHIDLFQAASPFAHLGEIGEGYLIGDPEDLTINGSNYLLVADDTGFKIDVFNANSPFDYVTSFGTGFIDDPEAIITCGETVFVMDDDDDVLYLFKIEPVEAVPTISQVDENGDGIPDIVDPCSCADPLNIVGADGIEEEVGR